MKLRFTCILTLGLNVALTAVLFVLWRNQPAPQPAAALEPAPVPAKRASALPATKDAPAAALPRFHWRMIESPDYRQYVANLRAVGCPERTLRDIIVSDLDQLYAAKNKSAQYDPPPWHNAVRRRAEERLRADQEAALTAEKRAMVKELIGYEWDHQANEVWHQDSITALLLGFLPGSKPPQLMALVANYSGQAANIRAAANDILIDEDRARLGKLHDELAAEVSRLLGPAEREELELRIQAALFIPANDIHWDGVAITGAEFREMVRRSKSFKDAYRNEYLGLGNALGTTEKAAFEKQVAALLGPRFADYQRAQDRIFREVVEFTRENDLPAATAIHIYNSRRHAEDQAAQLKQDESLSADERAVALAGLKAATDKAVSVQLGHKYSDYRDGPGSWLESLTGVETEAPSARP